MANRIYFLQLHFDEGQIEFITSKVNFLEISLTPRLKTFSQE